MSVITITHLYERMASAFGKEPAENVSSFIDFKITEGMNNHLRVLATKQEMTEGFAKAKLELMEGLAAVRQEMAALEVRLTEKIVGTKAEIIKWMFIFWVSQMLAMFGYLQFFVKK
jgi:hypothetical protein